MIKTSCDGVSEQLAEARSLDYGHHNIIAYLRCDTNDSTIKRDLKQLCQAGLLETHVEGCIVLEKLPIDPHIYLTSTTVPPILPQ